MRTLLIRPGAIGDCIVSFPALEHLQTAYTEIWVPTTVVPLVRFGNKVESIARTGLDLVGIRTPFRTMERLAEFDRIHTWYGTANDDFRAAVAHLPVTFYRALPPEDSPVHAIDFYAAQVGAPPGLTPQIPVTAPPRDEIVIHPFSGSARKNWPLDRFRALAGQLPLPVTWIAGPDEPLKDAVHFDDLGKLAERLSGARLYIGNDSGISHLAAAVGTPVVALFGLSNPKIWSPRPSHVRIFINEAGIPGLVDICIGIVGRRQQNRDHCW